MKLNKRTNLLNLSMLLLLLFTTGCYYDEVLPVEPEGDISFAADIQPFFDTKCASCHNGGSIPLNLLSGDAYDALFSGNYINTADPTSSSLYTKIDAGESMEQYATDTERALLLKWIEQGANDN